MTNNEIRVRFAPSPTGALHLGGARTAIYNWLFARSVGGKFLLRIEDTDVERSRKELVGQIMQSLDWLGLKWDEEPVYQSNRMALYKSRVNELLVKGKAYRCFCRADELDAEREKAVQEHRAYKYGGKCRSLSQKEIDENLSVGKPYAVRFKMEDGITGWNDLVYGKIYVQNCELDDLIIQRSTGVPVYQMAVVVDDIDMNITHIIRGEDHIPNTPKQINIFKAFGSEIPQFAHLPLLLGIDGKRLSKRHGATGVDAYQEIGYPAEAVFNYLALLGWSPKDGSEVLNPDEIVRQFQIHEISRKAAVFDIKKLDWISGQHLTLMKSEQILSDLRPLLEQANIPIDGNNQYVLRVIDMMKSRVKTFPQFVEWGKYFFLDPEYYDERVIAKQWKTSEVPNRMKVLKQELEKSVSFDEAVIESCVRKTAEIMQIKAAELIHPLRLALTGFGISPGIFEVAAFLGKEKVVRRIEKAIKSISISEE
ncbi:MAG: glutamate--tRNA ligase [Candidatus Marinimicrobia bacterium CG08_land_8_20_14_0_20_45_22]|nr:MAG: glutamate--tRNA ligase [Candidatus Marinimicrobia bacterium CG08_land_8_20_14_0_20_45_22]